MSSPSTGAEVARIVERELIPAWGHRAVAGIGRHDILNLIDVIAAVP